MVLGVALLAACTSTTTPTTTVVAPLTTLPSTTTPSDDPRLRLALPVDPEVVQGRLENGLNYYIRENDSPGGKAELRLVVDAGSVLEDADQAGAAHFLEHMMFNGTSRFPRNDLVAVLESFGPRFGPDINAYTSHDETVYELSLTTDDPELVTLGMEVLREWASDATLTETDVVAERGVVLDEWRLRAQGYEGRLGDRLDTLLLSKTAYEGHQPIGTRESIETITPPQLERFYTDWYRPERMAVVAVGDFDAADMEDLIVSTFDDLGVSGPERDPGPMEYSPHVEPVFMSYADEEAALASVTVLWATPPLPLATVGDYQNNLASSFALEILTERLADDAASGETPLLGATVMDFPWTREILVQGVDVEVKTEDVESGLDHVLVEVERLRREGVTSEEVERTLESYAAYARQSYEEVESIQDAEFVSQIIDFHLGGGHLMDPGQRFDIESDILTRIDKPTIDAAIADLFEVSPSLFVLGPDAPGIEIPTAARVELAWEGLRSLELPDRRVFVDDGGDLMAPPDPAEIVSREVHPGYGFVTLEFDNGATVYIWRSDIAAGAVHVQVEGFGGTSQVDVEDLPEAYLMTEMTLRSGLGRLDEPALRRRLADRLVSVAPWLGETRQGLVGDSSTEDLESLFQMVNLTMTQPRFDAAAVDAVLDQMESLDVSRNELPDVLFDEAVNQAYYGADPRYFVLPTGDQLASFDTATAQRLYMERFGDASDFVFVFVGDFDVNEVADLASRYIGTLPGSGDGAAFVDHQPLPPRKVEIVEVEVGTGEQGRVGMFFTNEYVSTVDDRVAARLLELILSARLRSRVREELSATYSIETGIDLQREPDTFAEGYIMSTGDPSGLDEIVDGVTTELDQIRRQGPTTDELETAMEQLRDEYELVDNWTLAEAVVTAHLYPDQPVTELTDRYQLIGSVSADDIQRLATIVFNPAQRIEVRQVPRR